MTAWKILRAQGTKGVEEMKQADFVIRECEAMTAPRHILKEIVYLKPIHQWCATCSCGHESYDETKSEAMNWHRDHVDLAKRGIGRFYRETNIALALNPPPPVAYVSRGHYPDYTNDCTICGACVKPGEPCASCGSGESKPRRACACNGAHPEYKFHRADLCGDGERGNFTIPPPAENRPVQLPPMLDEITLPRHVLFAQLSAALAEIANLKERLKYAEHFFDSPASFSNEEFAAVAEQVYGVAGIKNYHGRCPHLDERCAAEAEIANLKEKITELDDALLYATDGEEEPTFAYQNCIDGGRKRRRESEGMDGRIEADRSSK